MRRVLGLFGLGILIAAVVATTISYKNRKWWGRERYTVIRIKNGVKFMSFDPATLQGIILEIPDGLEVKSVGGRGEWRAGVLGRAAEKFGFKWAADSLADYLGVAYTTEESHWGGWDRWQWWWWDRKVTWSTVDLEKTRWVQEITTIDGTKLLVLSTDWDERAGVWFLQMNVAKEGLNVTVENASAITGLGTHAARVIESGGMKVAMIKSSESELGRCVLSTNSKTRTSNGVKWLTKIFGCGWEESRDGDGEVLVKLGREYRGWWLGD